MTAKEISRELALRVENVSRYLLPNGKKQGHEWCVGSVSGEAGLSLKVHLSGDKAGVWADFATNENGDLLTLWARTRNLTISEAMKEAASYLGIAKPKFEAYRTSKFIKPKQKIIPLVENSVSMNYLMNERQLELLTLQRFKIGVLYDEIVFPYWRDGEVVFIKHLKLARDNGKKEMRVEANCEPCLFGWQAIPELTRSVTICEGEIDAMTLWQYGLPALSVPFGGGKGDKQRWIEYEYDNLNRFDEIFICMDNDDAGIAAAKEIIERLGAHRCPLVDLPMKDANECLVNGISAEDMKYFINEAKTLDPEELKPANTFTQQVIEEFYPPEGSPIGYAPPWEKSKGKLVFRPDEISVWTGINGHGKSQFLGQVILSAMQQGAKVCIASLEIKPKRLLMRLTRQAGALEQPSPEYIEAIHDWYGDKLWLFDLVGTAKSQRLLEVFRYARQRYGVDVFVIDSFMKLDIAEDDYKAQKTFMEQLCDFKNQYNCHVHIVIHPRKGANEATPPGKLDNRGTGALSDLADNCFTVWRNKDKEALRQKQNMGVGLNSKELSQLDSSDCLWCCDKQRNGDWEGKFGFWFHPGTLQYLPTANYKPIRYVDYSRST